MTKTISIGLVAIAWACATAGAANSFRGIGFTGPDNATEQQSKAFSISADGSTVVGYATFIQHYQVSEPYTGGIRYTDAGGIEHFDMNVGTHWTYGEEYPYNAVATSSDGSIIFGNSGALWVSASVYKWENGITTHPDVYYSVTDNVIVKKSSDDGHRLIGTGANDGSVLSWWAQDVSNNTHFGYVPENGYSRVYGGISPDGSSLLGSSKVTPESTIWTPTHWDWDTGVATFLSELAGGVSDSSTDGNIVVGGESGIATRWTLGAEKIVMGDLPGGMERSWATSVSADGSVAIGYGHDADGKKPILWDEIHGLRNLQLALTNQYGLDLTGWDLVEATGISGDGTAIVGWGTNPDGVTEGWIARIPEPTTAMLLALPMLAAIRRRRR